MKEVEKSWRDILFETILTEKFQLKRKKKMDMAGFKR
jgi:hypothetical protein